MSYLPTSVHIVLIVVGAVVVYDQDQMFHIQTTSCYRCRHLTMEEHLLMFKCQINIFYYIRFF